MSIVERALAKGREQAGAAHRTPRLPRPNVDPRPQGETSRQAPDAPAPDVSAGVIDIQTSALQPFGLAVPHSSQQRIAEELRVIKRPLMLNAESDSQLPDGNLLMVGSALPGAGKTFLSIHLAVSMASELDWRVLLIDSDISRPTLSRALGLGDAPGLVDLLQHEHGSISEHVFKTNHPDLHFLPAGVPQSHAKELLGSQRMRTLLADLNAWHPRLIVLFDSPPLLLTSEARVLASYVGQIVLVVEAGRTPRRSVLEAIELLDPSKAVNLVLNKSSQMLGIGDYNYELYGRDAERDTEN
jgi:protein-tyrosine kinase